LKGRKISLTPISESALGLGTVLFEREDEPAWAIRPILSADGEISVEDFAIPYPDWFGNPMFSDTACTAREQGGVATFDWLLDFHPLPLRNIDDGEENQGAKVHRGRYQSCYEHDGNYNEAFFHGILL